MRTMLVGMFVSVIGVMGAPVFSGDLTCWDRNINSVVNAFSSRTAADSWYPKYLHITDEEVQWGSGADSWYEPDRNIGNSYRDAQASVSGELFKYKYSAGNNNLTVIMVAQPGYKTSKFSNL